MRRKFMWWNKNKKGQSFVELALVLPVLIVILLGMVEVAFYISTYLDMLDLTREAARFASVRDPFAKNIADDLDCLTENQFNFYYDTSCIFSPVNSGAITCDDPKYCNGMNAYVKLDLTRDDVVLSLYTVDADGKISNVHPSTGYWALSNVDSNGSFNDNWKRDCKGNQVRTEPYFTKAMVQARLDAGAPASKGFVAVELYYCYEQVLGLPGFDLLDPLMMHAYTLMPLPAASPTRVP